MSETKHESLAAALAALQGELPKVRKGNTADTGKYSYKYADLGDIAEVAYPLLSKHGLSFTCRPALVAGTGFVLKGILRHTSGERDVGILPITGRDAQAIGSSLTYNRRYLLGCMTGIVTDEDEDGNRAAAAGTDRPRAYMPPPPDPEHDDGPPPDAAARPTADPVRPAEQQPITAAQRTKIGACMSELGLKDRRTALAYVCDVIGRTVETRNDLTKTEAHSVIEALEVDLRQHRANTAGES